jgi:hypothetical protein
MTNPVMTALIAARQQQLNRGEAIIAEEVNAALGPAPPDTHRPERFIKWCDEQSLPWRPACPSVIAKFVLGHTKIGSLLEEIRAISEAHCSTGLPDPTAAWQVSRAVLRLTKVEPPRSWPDAEKVVFLSLPPDLQRYLIVREKDRDLTTRRALNEAGEARKQLADIQKGTEANGTIEIQPEDQPTPA